VRLIAGSGVDLHRFSPRNSRQDFGSEFRLLFAARLLRDKGLLELSEAVRGLVAEGRNITLVCAGDLYPDNPTSLSSDELSAFRREPFFEFLGYQEHMARLIDSVDAVALPTFYREGASRLLMEAGAMGKPVITTTIPGNEGLVIDGETGILVPPREVAPLRDAIVALMDDDELRSRLGQAARVHVAERFGEERVIEETLKVYDEAMIEAGLKLGADR
jgi:glycosyltransferase involved in cell wall biosynthesis